MSPTIDPLATLPKPPSSLLKYGKYLWYVLRDVGEGVLYKQFENAAQMNPANAGAGAPPADEWRRFAFRFHSTSSSLEADVAVNTFDVVKWDGTNVDSDWSEAEHEGIANSIMSFYQAVAVHLDSTYSLFEIAAYRMAFNAYDYSVTDPDHPNDPPKFPPFALSGAPLWQSSESVPFLSVGGIAHQVSFSLTERTPSRRNWGRVYLPPIGRDTIGPNGLVVNAVVTSLVDAYALIPEILSTSNYALVVPTTSVGKVPTRTLQNVTGVSGDNVPDIQRRRRASNISFQVIDETP